MRLKKFILIISVTLICLFILSISSYAQVEDSCTSIIVGKDASVDGSVMTTHTCDGWYDNRIQIVPGQTFEKGTMTNVYTEICHLTQPGKELIKVGEIPQAEKTYTISMLAIPL